MHRVKGANMKNDFVGRGSRAGGSTSTSNQSSGNPSSTTHQDAAKDVASDAGAKANQFKDKVVQESTKARDELQSSASGLFSDLRGAVADQIDRLTEVLHGSEREMKKQNLDEFATYPTVLAQQIEDVNAYLRERSGGGMRRDFERAISKQPIAVIGGLAAVGALTAWYLQSDRTSNGRSGNGEHHGQRARSADERGASGGDDPHGGEQRGRA